ncbi:hypothetical protein Micbo1qcDRAFT_157569 [Microdochium bolleyi]|uniref:Uncharacterized protein n=1 Tax=Microdochium bolleyi TaxID=196109 RepID=A0A136JEI3_9PEZI|nr:hypothetical protein Micbo1qcDRAFT_157569 [Microdochium bolleyi]
MAPPFQRLAVLGNSGVLCAARGPQILTFNTEGQAVSSWTHPSARATETPQDGTADPSGDVEMNENEPPAKKRRVGDAESTTTAESDSKQETPSSEQATNGKGQRKQRAPVAKQDHQFIINLVATMDGSHVVAVSGQDKALWVFEHDGAGGLSELSTRVMPKRPSSIDITSDGKTIVCADKFGDVYSLPLVSGQSASNEAENGSEAPSSTQTATAQGKLRIVSKKGANELTVHSKRNLRALEEQRRRKEQLKDMPKEGPDFEHNLLLGHVSMLTGILSVVVDSRPYLLTADRDEHIRISRGIPQSHIIEGFCLGHTSFVNALCIPNTRPDVLVSGGGDKELYVWKWLENQLLAKVDLLSHVQEVIPGASQVAVLQLLSYKPGNSEKTCIIAVCEKVPAIFVFNLAQDGLNFVQTIKTLANPLDAVVLQKDGGQQLLVVGVDSDHEQHSLVAYEHDPSNSGWTAEPTSPFDCGKAESGSGPEVSREDLDRLLYTVENLRKTDMDEAGEDDGGVSTSVQPDDSKGTTPAVEAA